MLDLFKYTETQMKSLIKSMVILIDTREHEGKNEHIINYFEKAGINYKKKKLDYGDYSFMISKNEELFIPTDLDFSSKIIIERKASLDEISGNLTTNRDRLEKELALAPSKKVLIIESGTYQDMVNGNYRTQYNNKSFWASYHSLWHKYNIPIIFMPDKSYTGFFIRGYFEYYLKNYLR